MAHVCWTYTLNISVDKLHCLIVEGRNFLFISFTYKYFSISTLKKKTHHHNFPEDGRYEKKGNQMVAFFF